MSIETTAGIERHWWTCPHCGWKKLIVARDRTCRRLAQKLERARTRVRKHIPGAQAKFEKVRQRYAAAIRNCTWAEREKLEAEKMIE